jgi:hypothetical protein
MQNAIPVAIENYIRSGSITSDLTISQRLMKNAVSNLSVPVPIDRLMIFMFMNACN